MRKSKFDHLEALRNHARKRTNIRRKGDYILLGHERVGLQTVTAWRSPRTQKRYSLGALWLLLEHELKKEPIGKEYMGEAIELGVEPVNQLDREEVIRYFRGEIETTEDIDPMLRLEVNQQPADQPVLAQDPELEDINQLLEWLHKCEKAVSSKTKSMRTPERSYTVVVNLLREMEKKIGVRESRVKPVIIIPQPEIPGNLSMRNVRQFLLDGEYVDHEKCPDLPDQRIEVRYQGRPFEIVSNADLLLNEEWDKVVAIFVSGRKSQFSLWPEKSIGSIFARYKAFYMKQVDAAPGEARDWNVHVLNVHAVRRHENRELAKTFWAEVMPRVRQM